MSLIRSTFSLCTWFLHHSKRHATRRIPPILSSVAIIRSRKETSKSCVRAITTTHVSICTPTPFKDTISARSPPPLQILTALSFATLFTAIPRWTNQPLPQWWSRGLRQPCATPVCFRVYVGGFTRAGYGTCLCPRVRACIHANVYTRVPWPWSSAAIAPNFELASPTNLEIYSATTRSSPSPKELQSLVRDICIHSCLRVHMCAHFV